MSAICLACVGILLPDATLHAAGGDDARPAGPAKPSIITDVELAPGGVMLGQIVDEQGLGRSGIPVTIRGADRQMVTTRADRDGRFQVPNLRGGLYHVTAGQDRRIVRAWAAATAPPSARKHVTLVARRVVVRAKNLAELDTNWDGEPDYGLTVIDVALIGSSVAAITVSAISLSKLNDVEDIVDKLPKSP